MFATSAASPSLILVPEDAMLPLIQGKSPTCALCVVFLLLVWTI